MSMTAVEAVEAAIKALDVAERAVLMMPCRPSQWLTSARVDGAASQVRAARRRLAGVLDLVDTITDDYATPGAGMGNTMSTAQRAEQVARLAVLRRARA